MHNAPASSVSIDMSVSKMILVGDMKSAVRRPVRPDVDMCTLHCTSPRPRAAHLLRSYYGVVRYSY